MTSDKKTSKQEFSFKLFPKPTYYVYLIMCCIVILGFVVLITTMLNKNTAVLPSSRFNVNTGKLYGKGRRTCDMEKVYCFTDNDCVQNCTEGFVNCVHGVCSTDVSVTNANNECDPSKGVIGFLTGNTALGTYDYICKSVDPGIAISVKENRMCFGDSTYVVDYLQAFPSIYTCGCDGKIEIPATSEKRLHVECDPRFQDLVT